VRRYGRVLGKVTLDGKNINYLQAMQGLAWFYRDYAKDLRRDDAVTYEMDTSIDRRNLEAYEKIKQLAMMATDKLQKKIETVISELGDPYLVRRKSMIEARTKPHLSLARKARQRGWSFTKALTKAQDLVGLRIICHNLQEVRRVADLLETTLVSDNFNVKRDDYITNPKRGGYRAIHLVFQMPISLGNDEAKLGCEIQVRSLLQDSWAELSHAEIY
jgi:ppGpp synthetase/RelA/SpoT-type nucleotidyltranferase